MTSVNYSSSTSEGEVKTKRDQLRRVRNVKSAKRSKDRLKNEHIWMEIQTLENEDRIKYLESRMEVLVAELESSPTKSKASKQKHYQMPDGKDRPSWFGAPF